MKKMKQILARSFVSAVITVSASHAVANPTADYFARFKYTMAEAIELLQKADGKPMADVVEARNLLDDMGYWKRVRQDSVLHFTPELKAQVEAQFKYLEKAYSYETGDLVWIKTEGPQDRAYGIGQVNHRAQIVDHAQVSGVDYYTVDVYVDGPSKMAPHMGTFYNGQKGNVIYYGPNYSLEKTTKILTKAELDTLNSPASSLPQDKAGEVLDWQNDQVWRDKLEQFKVKMTAKNFEINYTAPASAIEKQQQELMLDIFRHFKMNRNAPSNSGKGIGMRACGGGVCFDQALVLSYAIQALGQTSGIKAFNLNGTTVNPQGGHGFVRYDLKTNPQTITFDKVFPYELWEEALQKNKAAIKAGTTTEINLTLPPEKATYKGVDVKTSTWSGISDPGWADYGVTPDFFARMSVAQALNPLPIDSNRAVHGLSAQRNLVEVAQQLHAKGPMNTFVQQAAVVLDVNSRAKIIEEIKQGKKLKSALQDHLGAGLSCSRVFEF
jgi:hypothetical protein